MRTREIQDGGSSEGGGDLDFGEAVMRATVIRQENRREKKTD